MVILQSVRLAFFFTCLVCLAFLASVKLHMLVCLYLEFDFIINKFLICFCRLSTPSIPAVPLTAASVYQPHHVPSTSMVAPASMFTSQQQPGPSSQTVYHNQQSISHAVYQSSALLNRAQVRLMIYIVSIELSS